jgi:hypothetical protein
VPKSEQGNKENTNPSQQECVGRPTSELSASKDIRSNILSEGGNILLGESTNDPLGDIAQARNMITVGRRSYANAVRGANASPITFNNLDLKALLSSLSILLIYLEQ